MTAQPTGNTRRRFAVLFICSMSLFLVGIDVTAVNVALPTIGKEMDADLAWLQWTVSAYTVMMASLLIFSGSMGDRLGRKRILMTGMAVFTLGSLLCGVAPSVEFLVAARVLQGIGASMLNPVAMSIVTNTFTEPRERAQAIGIWGAVFGVSLALGPLVGGAMVSSVGWNWIFFMNIPIGLAAILLTFRFVPDSRAPKARRFDPVGQCLMILLLFSVTFGIIEAPSEGWASPMILGTFAISIGALIGILLYEPRRDQPLINLGFFRSIQFSASIALAVAAFASFGGFLFLNALYLQDERGLSAIEAGLAVVPIALMTVVFSPISGRITGQRGPRLPLVIAGTTSTIGCAMLTTIGPETPFAWIIASSLVFGVGLGFVNAPITNAAVSGMPDSQAGVAAALATTSRQFGQAIGVAITGAILAGQQSGVAGDGVGAASQPAWWVLTGIGIGMLGLGLLATSHAAAKSAARTRAALDADSVLA